MRRETIGYKGFDIEIEYDEIAEEWVAVGRENGSSFVLASSTREECLNLMKEEIDMLLTSRYLNKLSMEGFSEH